MSFISLTVTNSPFVGGRMERWVSLFGGIAMLLSLLGLAGLALRRV